MTPNTPTPVASRPKITMTLAELPEWIERTIETLEDPVFSGAYTPADIANSLRNMLNVLAETQREAALASPAGEGDAPQGGPNAEPIAWRVQTPYGEGYSFASEEVMCGLADWFARFVPSSAVQSEDGVDTINAATLSDAADDPALGLPEARAMLRDASGLIRRLATPEQPIDRARFRKAPCYLCGYNGGGYYQPATHPCATKFHAAEQPGSAVQGEVVAWQVRIGSSDVWSGCHSKELADFYGRQSGTRYETRPLYTTPPPAPAAEQGEPVEMSPEFTDSARAALAWVLFHHQGGNSPVGQPIRFALGMGAHERLPDWRIAEAKAWADRTGSKTADFHATQPEARGVEGMDFLRHVASVCRGAVDLCEPKPQRTPEDDREHNGGLCLSELANIADEIERRLATPTPVRAEQPEGQGALKLPPDTSPFADWLAREMPPGTVIGDPGWWAPRILRQIAMLAGAPGAAGPMRVDEAMVSRALSAAMRERGECAHLGLAPGARHRREIRAALTAALAGKDGAKPVRDQDGNAICTCTHDALCPIHEAGRDG